MFYNLWVKFLLWIIRRSFKHKDRTLSYQLHNLADEYNPRPERKWS